jgi:hypothetical protein
METMMIRAEQNSSKATQTNKSLAVSQPPVSAPIRADECYRLSEVARRMGWQKFALATAKRNGLPVRRLGRRHLVLGSEFLEWITTAAPLI